MAFYMKFDYSKEPRRDILCIDVKSFYASVECVERGLDPLKTMLIVMSGADNAGGLVLAASPMAKKVLGISNVTRKDEVLLKFENGLVLFVMLIMLVISMLVSIF